MHQSQAYLLLSLTKTKDISLDGTGNECYLFSSLRDALDCWPKKVGRKDKEVGLLKSRVIDFLV